MPEDVDRMKKISGLYKGYKAQVSLEMLLIVTFLFVTLIPLVLYMYNIFSKESWKVDIQQSQSVIANLVDYSNKLTAGGEYASATILLYFPSKVKNLTTVGRAIIITSDIPQLGVIDQVALAKVPINATLQDWSYITGMQQVHLNYSGGTVYIYR